MREQAGWERVYRLLPAANPGSAAHVLVLVTPQQRSRAGFPERLGAPGPAARLARAHPAWPTRWPRRRARRRRAAPTRWPRSAGTPTAAARADGRRPAARLPGRGAEAAPRPAAAPTAAPRRRPSRLRPMIPARANRLQLAAGAAAARGRCTSTCGRGSGAPGSSPDFLFVGLMLFAMRSRPGVGGAGRVLVGLIADSLTPARFGAAALAHTRGRLSRRPGRGRYSSPTTCWSTPAFVAAGRLAPRLHRADRERQLASGSFLTELARLQPAPGADVGAVRADRAARIPRVVLDPAGRVRRPMNGFDSYRVRERADVARLDPDRRLPGTGRARSSGPRSSSTTSSSSRPKPTGSGRSRSRRPAARSWTGTGEIIAENVPGYSVKLLAPNADSLRAVLRRFADSSRSTASDIDEIVRRYRRRPLPAGRSCSATPTSRPCAAAGGASGAPAGAGDPVRAQAALSRRARRSPIWSGMSPRSPSPTSPPTAFPARGWAPSSARRASSGSTTTPSGAPRACATSR